LAANKTATPKKKQIAIPPLAIVVVLLLAAGLAGFLYLDRAAKRPPPPPRRSRPRPGCTCESEAQRRQMNAHESYLKQSVVEITGNIENAGGRKMALVEITCVFYDAYGQVVLRERVPIVSRKTGGVAPGETKSFRLPSTTSRKAGTNDASTVIARIDFG